MRLSGDAWIRLSTGKLCVNVGNGEELIGIFFMWHVRTKFPSIKFTENDLDDKLLSRLKLDDLYHLLTRHYTWDVAHFSSTLGTIMLPSLCRIPDPGADFDATEISAIPIANHFTPSSIYVESWYSRTFQVETLATGWTRVDYLDSHGRLSIDIRLVDEDDARKWWVLQQGYVIAQLQDAISFDDEMVFVTAIGFYCTFNTSPENFTLQGTFMADAPTDDVYLFIFSPKVDLVDGRFIVTSPPAAERYYWAFDPAGLDRLTDPTAEDLGLPTPEFSIKLWGIQWTKRLHDITCDFHTAKGFDPCSRDMAIAMGYPLVDLEDINKFAQELTGKGVTDCPDAGIEDEIYYSFGLC
ncbi:hypothetical protein B0H19DRAFT_74453 [Mycena capillaripes]|nr:hypothetical protein B0H19DRAFT_74453 [Mycena capillaripes]